MSQPDTIWWCDRYRAPGDQAYCLNVPDAATRHQDCGPRRLVSPSALVIERDETGEWPAETVETIRSWAFDPPTASKLRPTVESTLDALAASQDPSSTFGPSDPPIGR